MTYAISTHFKAFLVFVLLIGTTAAQAIFIPENCNSILPITQWLLNKKMMIFSKTRPLKGKTHEKDFFTFYYRNS